ncbi:XTP/dITP diphosphatase [Clostridium niameyense]|uniref:dITP/XTP pyrophosphatase n=1 Tax=Clostridium niameyense TaxID=1622073 RepID=A0A6M0R990_9CLOT|nr:XTP/dITP diphosphatase [Clostridium niameyense]NEZ46835.1 XTP/dITP diphosphatase [Clostridium niameyense]
MNKKVIVASNNSHKIREIKEILIKYNMEVMSMKEAGIEVDIEENGKTFMENAFKKADTIHKLMPKCMIIADDSGLMVDALGGAPGIYSARFAGEHGNYKKNNEKLLSLLKDEKNKNAKFVSAVVFIINDEEIIKVQGEINGVIIDEEKGENGFGYDPLFYVPKYNKTFAQMESELKNAISHRANALSKLQREIEKYVEK